MQINNFYLSPFTVSPAETPNPAEPPSKNTPASNPLDASSSHTLSPELLHLIALVQNEPEVRPEAVQQAATRLSQGFYSTPASAEQTASAILNASE
jgi:hypothetical protein